MNINIVDLIESSFQVGDEIAVFDGDICVGAVKLSEIDFNNNALSIPASASEFSRDNGFVEGNNIELKAWENESNKESKLIPMVNEGKMLFNKQASVFASFKGQTTSTEDLFNNLQIVMYPNPASSNVTIRFSVLPEEGTKILILDMMGREVFAKVVQNTSETINIQELQSGMYLVKTELFNKSKIQKLIKK
jgi:hypothetical protein